jgi:hypothetical protein
MTIVRMCLAALMAVVSGTGCGLISSNVTDFDLALPDKTFTVDTSSWMVNQTAATAYLGQSCASAPSECEQEVQSACTTGCSGVCDSGTMKCDLGLDVSDYTGVNLLMEEPELSTINSEPIIKVSIDGVTYDVTQNTLSVATPTFTVYVAPMTVMDPTSPMAQAIGTIAPVPAGSTFTGMNMQFTSAGMADLANIMGTYKVPFNVLVGAQLTVTDGEPLPTGAITAVVHITAHAGT